MQRGGGGQGGAPACPEGAAFECVGFFGFDEGLQLAVGKLRGRGGRGEGRGRAGRGKGLGLQYNIIRVLGLYYHLITWYTCRAPVFLG